MQHIFGKNTIGGRLSLTYFYSGLGVLGYDVDRNREKVIKIKIFIKSIILDFSCCKSIIRKYAKKWFKLWINARIV